MGGSRLMCDDLLSHNKRSVGDLNFKYTETRARGVGGCRGGGGGESLCTLLRITPQNIIFWTEGYEVIT